MADTGRRLSGYSAVLCGSVCFGGADVFSLLGAAGGGCCRNVHRGGSADVVLYMAVQRGLRDTLFNRGAVVRRRTGAALERGYA